MTDKSAKVSQIKVPEIGPEPLGRFMVRHMTNKQIETLLEKMDTHPSHGKGEKSRA